MTTAANPPLPAPSAAALAVASPAPAVPTVMGETRLDRVSSLLMSLVIGMAFTVGLLWLIYLTNKAYNTKITADIQIVEVVGGPGGGGIPEGAPNESAPDSPPGEFNPTGEVEVSDFQEPSFQQVNTTALDMSAPVNDSDSVAEVDISSPNATSASPRPSRVPTGRVGLGTGGYGDGGVRREQRWSVVYNPGQTLDEYARQLDAFGVEIGVIKNNSMLYVSKFSSGSPVTRYGQHATDTRLFFVWQSNTRKGSDVELLRRANVDVGESPIFHFYPKAIEDRLAQYEARYRGRQPIEIKATRFSVVSRGGSYDFAVLAQDPMPR
jgi:hypothetical protein